MCAVSGRGGGPRLRRGKAQCPAPAIRRYGTGIAARLPPAACRASSTTISENAQSPHREGTSCIWFMPSPRQAARIRAVRAIRGSAGRQAGGPGPARLKPGEAAHEGSGDRRRGARAARGAGARVQGERGPGQGLGQRAQPAGPDHSGGPAARGTRQRRHGGGARVGRRGRRRRRRGAGVPPRRSRDVLGRDAPHRAPDHARRARHQRPARRRRIGADPGRELRRRADGDPDRPPQGRGHRARHLARCCVSSSSART